MATRRRNEGSDLAARVIVALPAIVFAIVIVLEGGVVFAAGILMLGMVALAELFNMMSRVRPPVVAGYIGVIGLVLAARYGGRHEVLIVLMCCFPLVFVMTAARRRREHASWAMAVVFLGIVWIGLPLAHAQLLRDLPHGGALMVDTLIGTFIGDTAAYFGGRLYGRTLLAPRISPNKTVEGLVAGLVGGTFAFWFASTYQDWLSSTDALIIGACVAAAAPIGDLFESLIKRDLEVKDTGGLFGAHGGVLDRLDAVFFSVPVAYYASLAVLS